MSGEQSRAARRTELLGAFPQEPGSPVPGIRILLLASGFWPRNRSGSGLVLAWAQSRVRRWPGQARRGQKYPGNILAPAWPGLWMVRLLCWLCADKRIVLSTGMIYAPAHSNWANRRTNERRTGRAIEDFPPASSPAASCLCPFPFPSPSPLRHFHLQDVFFSHISVRFLWNPDDSPPPSYMRRAEGASFFASLAAVLFPGLGFLSFFSERVCRVEKLV